MLVQINCKGVLRQAQDIKVFKKKKTNRQNSDLDVLAVIGQLPETP